MTQTASGPTMTAEVAELLDELIATVKADRDADIEAWLAEHVEHAEELRPLVPTVQLMAQLSHSAGEPVSLADERVLDGTLGDFRLIREVGRGGMGVVYEATQISLNRNVALKVLPFAATMDPRHLQRFRNEAQAAACLHHANIVPVHGVGCERGVHYYAMQLISGCSLAELNAEVKREDQSNHDDATDTKLKAPTDRRSSLCSLSRRGKERFRSIAHLIAQAADALEYAHSMGVVHRDVKPANLMLDDAGHLWVTDFGLAKLGADAGVTMTGDLIGTLRYMSPEQALARHGLVDHRTDVYSLGATLYELLTLRPAVDGDDKQEVLKKIAFEEPVALRKINHSIPVELETITLKCLAKNPIERYATAGEVADDLRRWLGDQTIKAKPPGWREKTSKWVRRHKYLVRSSFAVMTVAVVAMAVSNLMITREKNQKQEALERSQKRLTQIERGVDLLGALLLGINPRDEKKGDEPMTQRLRKNAERAAAELDEDKVGDPLVVARLQTILGSALIDLGSYDRAVNILEKARAIREKQLGCDHPDTLTTLHFLAASYRSIGRQSEAVQLHEHVWRAQEWTLGADHPDTVATRSNLAVMYSEAGKLPEAISMLELIANDEIAKFGVNHSRTLSTMHNLAIAYGKAGKLNQAIQLAEQVRDGLVAQLGSDHPDTIVACSCLATAYWQAGKLELAIQHFEQARDASVGKLGVSHPETLTILNNLAGVYQKAGRLTDSIRLFEQVRDARVAKHGADHPNTLATLAGLALAYQSAGNIPEATKLFEKVRDSFVDKLGADHPDTLTIISNLARAYQAARRIPAAIQLYEQARDAKVAKLGSNHPSTLETLGNLAGAYRAAGRLPEAIRLYEQVRDAYLATVGTDHPSTLTTLNNLAFAYIAVDRKSDAIPLLEQASVGIVKCNFLHEHAGLIVPNTVNVLEAERSYSAAEVWQRRWLAHVKEKTGSESVAYAGELARLGLLLVRQQKWGEAEKALRECLPMREKHQPDAWTTFNTMSLLGAAKLGEKRYVDAEPLLINGYEGMKVRTDQIPKQLRHRLREAVDRLIELNSTLARPDEVVKWRKEADSLQME